VLIFLNSAIKIKLSIIFTTYYDGVAGTARGLIINLRSKSGVLASFFELFLCLFESKNIIF
jgi:hypothetical protein